MLELVFFVLGVVNTLMLTVIFVVRRNRLALLSRMGWTYLLLSIPAAYALFLVVQEQKSYQYAIFLGLFLAFLLSEWLLDFALKRDFRNDWRRNWKVLAPYICLYYASNYGFVVMPWKTSLVWGLTMLGLFIVQLVANLRSHSCGR